MNKNGKAPNGNGYLYAIMQRTGEKTGIVRWFVASQVEAQAVIDFARELDPVFFNTEEGKLSFCKIEVTPAIMVVLHLIRQQIDRNKN